MEPVLKILTAWKGGITKTTTQPSCLNYSKLKWPETTSLPWYCLIKTVITLSTIDWPMNAGSVPVVMSTDKLDEFLPGNLKHSVIKVRDFSSPKHLADYLKGLSKNENEYNKYLEWKWKGYGDITGTVIGDFWMPKYSMYYQVCCTKVVALSEGRQHKEGFKPIPCNARRLEDWEIKKVD